MTLSERPSRPRRAHALILALFFAFLAAGLGQTPLLAATSATNGTWLATEYRPGLLPPDTERLVISDLDGDGGLEALASQGRTFAAVRLKDGMSLGMWEFERPITTLTAFDLDRDGRDEVGVGLADSGRQLILKWSAGAWNVIDEKFLWATVDDIELVPTPLGAEVVSASAVGQLFVWRYDGHGLVSVAKSELLQGASLWLYPTGSDGVLGFRSGINRVGLLVFPPSPPASLATPDKAAKPVVAAWSNYPWGGVTAVTAAPRRWLLAASSKGLLYAYSLSDPAGALAWQASIPFFDLADLAWTRRGDASFAVGRSQGRVVAASVATAGLGPWWQSRLFSGLKGIQSLGQDGSVWAWTASGALLRFEYLNLDGWEGRLAEGSPGGQGQPTSSPVPFAVRGGALLVAARELMQLTGMELSWVGQNKKEVLLSVGDHFLRTVPGTAVMDLDGRQTGGLAPLQVTDGRLYLPVTVLEQWLGWQVEADRENRVFYLHIQE